MRLIIKNNPPTDINLNNSVLKINNQNSSSYNIIISLSSFPTIIELGVVLLIKENTLSESVLFFISSTELKNSSKSFYVLQ